MFYSNACCVIKRKGDSNKTESRVLYLTPGSDIAVMKCRSEGGWLTSYEKRIPLPFAFDGVSETKIWLITDTHIGFSADAKTDFEAAITDVDNNIGVDYVFHGGDCTDTGESVQYDDYITAKATSAVPDSNWFECCGNHDHVGVNGNGDDSRFKEKLGYNDVNYTITVGNCAFIFIGGHGKNTGLGLALSYMTDEALAFLETEVKANKDKNIFVICHYTIYDTTYRTTTLYYYIQPVAEIQAIIDNNRIEAWIHGHTHGNQEDYEFYLFNPLTLYDSLDITANAGLKSLKDSLEISEGISFLHCPSVNKSVYKTFKYGSRKYGKNISVCEELFTITEDSLVKKDGDIFKSFGNNVTISESLIRVSQAIREFSDTLSFSESLVSATEFHLSFSDSITIDDGFGVSYVLNLSDSVSIDTLLEIEKEEGLTYKSRWKFLIKDSSGNYLASLVNARGRWFTQRLNDQSEAGFILDVDDDNCSETILALGQNTLEIEYRGTLMWAGQLASAKKIANGNDIYWEVLAKDWVSLLSKRFIGVESLREFTTIDAGTIAWTLIDETQSLTYGDFGITEGTIETSITRSPSYDRKNLLEAIRELSNMGKDGEANYGFDFEITPEKVFNIYYPYKGTIREDVVFRYPGNCENFEAFVDSWDIINQEWGLGRHWTGNTAIVSRADATSQATYKRREAIKNYHDMAVLEFLQDMVYQDVQWNKNPSTVVRFNARVDEKVQLEDYNVGDAVTVVCDSFDVDEWLWVYERKIEVGDDDEPKVTLTLGD